MYVKVAHIQSSKHHKNISHNVYFFLPVSPKRKKIFVHGKLIAHQEPTIRCFGSLWMFYLFSMTEDFFIIMLNSPSIISYHNILLSIYQSGKITALHNTYFVLHISFTFLVFGLLKYFSFFILFYFILWMF